MQKPMYLQKDADTNRGPSPGIWADCPVMEMIHDPSVGFHLWDDFFGSGEGTDTGQTWSAPSGGGRYLCFGITGATVQAKTSVAGALTGILELDVDADDEENYLGFDTTHSSPFGEISDTAGHNKKLWFEGRVRFDNVDSGATACGKLFGLGASGMNVTGAIGADAGSIAAVSFLGFRALAADGDGLDAVYGDGTEVVLAESAAGLAAQTLTAAVWVKLGIYFDGTRTYWYVNGEKVTGTGVLPAATNFPDAAALHPIFGIREHGTADFEADIDWWRFAKLF